MEDYKYLPKWSDKPALQPFVEFLSVNEKVETPEEREFKGNNKKAKDYYLIG